MMNLRWRIAVAALGVAVVAAAADSGRFHGPITGWVVDGRSGWLRPVNGIPGGATLGAPLHLGFRVSEAVVSVENDFAVVTALRAARGPLLLRGLASGSPEIVALDGTIAATALDASDGGTSVVLSSAANARLQLVRGLPDQPEVLAAVDVSNWGGGIAAAAVDPAGKHVLGAAGDGGIYLFTVQGKSLGEPVWLGRVPGAAAVAFLGTDAAAAGSSTTGDIILFQGLDGPLTVSRAAGAGEGFQSVTALRSAGGQSLCAVEGISGRAAMIDVSATVVQFLPAAVGVNRCERLNRSVLALNQAGRQPLLLLDASGPPEVFFVPVN